MKTFKELTTGNNIFIISIDQSQRQITFKTVKYSISVGSKNDPTQLVIFFKDPTLSAITVQKESYQYKKESLDKKTNTYYFSDATALDLFLKDYIEKERTFIKNLESCSISAWSCERNRFHLEPGRIYYYSRFKTPCIVSNEGDAYDCDGFKISKASLSEETMREATKEERTKFFERLTTALKMKGSSEVLIAGLEKCGLGWNPAIKEIISI